MADRVLGDMSTDAAVVSDAFAAARDLLRSAEGEAVRLRADADRYVRQREQEAEILVAKARRLLAVAEEKAASMIATPRVETPGRATTPARVDDLGAGDAPRTADLDVIEGERASAVPATDGAIAVGRSVPTGLDRILASAIGKAVDRAFPPEA